MGYMKGLEFEKGKLPAWIFTRMSIEACGDMMYSGHTISAMVMLANAYFILRRKIPVVQHIQYSVPVIGVLLLGFIFVEYTVVMGKIHYASDIYIAIIIGILWI